MMNKWINEWINDDMDEWSMIMIMMNNWWNEWYEWYELMNIMNGLMNDDE